MSDWLGSLYFWVKVVAVLFGVLGGAFVGTLLSPLLVGDSKRRRLPVVFVCAALGGLALWLAMTRVGGGGGDGPGGPGAGGYASGGGQEAQEGPDATRKEPGAAGAVLRVHLLGGDRVKEERCYVIDRRPLNWQELIDAVTARQKQDPPLKTLEIVIHPDSVYRDHPAVRRLEDWARDHGLTPTMSFPKDKAPG
jgi:hypothetical protein